MKDISFHQISARGKAGSDLTMIEYSQRSRSFLYLSLASVIAVELKISNIYMFENGVIAFNIPMTQSRNYNNTKTAHPEYIKMYNTLLTNLFGVLSVQNPFAYMTKAEVLNNVTYGKIKNLITETVSCSHFERLRWTGVADIRHCGSCLPCLIRRISINASNLNSYDSEYLKDMLGHTNQIPHEGLTLIFEIFRFGSKLKKDDMTILNDDPNFLTGDLDRVGEVIISMYRRYFDEFKKLIAGAHSTLTDLLTTAGLL